MKTLTEIANNIGTDKGTAAGEKHNYTEVYEKYFLELKNKPVKMLEIGVWDNRFRGASARLWTQWFDNLDFIGLEINPDAKALEEELGIKIFTGDQLNVEDLKHCIEEHGSNYDVIIDDGVHTFDAIRISFESLYPSLKEGGLYIIEDIHANDARKIENWLKENNYEYASYCHTKRWSEGDKLIILTKPSSH